MAAKVLLVDDEPSILSVLKTLLIAEGFEVLATQDGNKAVELIRSQEFDLMLSDIRMTPVSGMELLRLAYDLRPAMAVIMITAFASIETAVEAVRMGAYDYITKPFKIDELLATVKRAMLYKKALSENVDLASMDSASFKLGAIVAQSAPMKNVCEMIRHVGPTNTTILVTGEPGTGKELVARTLHSTSGRKDNPFIVLDCSALGGDRIESDLFGSGQTAGAFEAATGGTLYLAEISFLPHLAQKRLLAAISEKHYSRTGAADVLTLDVRLVVGTSGNLQTSVKAGEFREDLYQRLSVIPIFLKPLRERKDDILPLISRILRLKLGDNAALPNLKPSAREALMRYSWPANGQELTETLSKAVDEHPGSELAAEHLPPAVASAAGSQDAGRRTDIQDENKGRSLKVFLKSKEKEYVEQVLKNTGGDKIKAAKTLDISLATLYRKLPGGENAPSV